MMVLDTTVLSELIRPSPDLRVVAWLDDQPSADIATTAITAAELRAGVALLPAGRRRQQVDDLVEQLLLETFARFVLPFDAQCTSAYAFVVSTWKKAGRPVSTADAQIAAICATHHAGLATRNTTDFVDVDVGLIDPWNA